MTQTQRKALMEAIKADDQLTQLFQRQYELYRHGDESEDWRKQVTENSEAIKRRERQLMQTVVAFSAPAP